MCGHWEIENQLHWELNVTIKEYNATSIVYRGKTAQILETVRHNALNMLRAENGTRRKQKIATMNSNYLEQVVLVVITAASEK